MMQESLPIAGTYTWGQFAPAFSLVGLAAALLMADAFLPKVSKRLYAIIGAIGAFIAAGFMLSGAYASSFGFLASIATGITLLLAYDYTKVTCASISGSERNEEGCGEFYALPLVACAGIYGITQASDLIMLFVNLEIVTLTSYVLTGYFRRNHGSIEAGVKYLILGALSTGFMVLGAAWYFGTTGTFLLSPLSFIGAYGTGSAVWTGFLMALVLLLVGAFFKVGAAPMHVWIPDVYQGAPTPTSAFLAVGSKVAGFALLCALVMPFFSVGSPLRWVLTVLFAVVTAATLLIGNLGAMSQRNAKRLLGYSSIGQAGFILAFFVAPRPNAEGSVFFYLLAYALATAAAFTAIAMVRTQRGSEEISAFRGLGKTNPRTAFLIVVSFASLAGVPLTLGFLAKLSSFISMVQAMKEEADMPGLMWVFGIMILCAASGFYYYFKIIRAMYWDKPLPEDKPLTVPGVTAFVLTTTSVILLLLGTLPLLFR